jgi:hypothetical protein
MRRASLALRATLPVQPQPRHRSGGGTGNRTGHPK